MEKYDERLFELLKKKNLVRLQNRVAGALLRPTVSEHAERAGGGQKACTPQATDRELQHPDGDIEPHPAGAGQLSVELRGAEGKQEADVGQVEARRV